jgi:phage-related protein
MSYLSFNEGVFDVVSSIKNRVVNNVSNAVNTVHRGVQSVSDGIQGVKDRVNNISNAGSNLVNAIKGKPTSGESFPNHEGGNGGMSREDYIKSRILSNYRPRT